MQTNELVFEELVPKARTTWSYLHLMAQTHKPLTYVVALAVEQLSVQQPLLQRLADKLRRRLAHEAAEKWAIPYIAHAVVVPAMDLGKYLHGVQVSRLP